MGERLIKTFCDLDDTKLIFKLYNTYANYDL